MKISRIVLRNFRGVVESATSFPEHGVTIVEGDNEVGKSCIGEAIDLVLHTPDSAMSRRIKAVCPVHRDVGPEVEIELTTGPYRFVLTKRWHRQRKTELTVLEPQRANFVGREAHDRVVEMLDETLDRPLFAVLQLQQGVDLEMPGFDVTSLGRALDLAVQGGSDAQVGDREDDLWTRITAERDRYWTPTGLRRVEREQLARELDTAKGDVETARAQLIELEHAADQVAALTEQGRVIVQADLEHERNEATYIAQWEAIEQSRHLVEQLAADREVATARAERLADELTRRNELIEQTAAAAALARDAISESDRVQPGLQALRRRAAEANRSLDVAKSALAESELAYGIACDDRDVRRGEIEIAQLTERRDRVRDAQRRLVDAEATLETARIDDERLAAIESAHLELLHAEARADRGLGALEVTSLDGSTIEIDGEVVDCVSGATTRRAVADVVNVTVAGVVQVRFHAGDDARAAGQLLQATQRKLAALLATSGVADVAAARAALAEYQGAEQVRNDALVTIGQDLRDLTIETLHAKIERLGVRLAAAAEARGDEPVMPVDLDAAQLAVQRRGAALETARSAFKRCDELAIALDAELHTAQYDGVSLQARIEPLESTSRHFAEALDQARSTRADDQIADECAAARFAADSAAAALDTARHALAADAPESVADLLANTRDARRRLAGEMVELTEARIKLETELDIKGELGLAEMLGDGQRRVARLQIEHDRLEARAVAARRLYTTFSTRRDAARDRYVSPFQNRIERLGKIVFGPSFEVTLDLDLRVATRTLDGVTLEVEQLSVGAREQLAILSRLACAALVSGDGGAPVILDDALGWTDPSRLERMGAAIAVAGRDCQVIVLTCTPGRYQSVGNASVVRLTRS